MSVDFQRENIIRKLIKLQTVHIKLLRNPRPGYFNYTLSLVNMSLSN